MNTVRNPSLFGHRKAGAALADGASVTSGVPAVEIFATGGAKVASVRFRATVAGTLALAYLRPRGPNEALVAYTASQPADTAITANTEAVVSLTPNGLSLLRATFTPSATGAITHCDVTFTD